MSYQTPLTADDLSVVTAFVDQVVARGLMAASSAEVEIIRRLVRDTCTHQRNTEGRLAYLRDAGIGYFTDEILAAAKLLSEEIVGAELRDELREQRRRAGIDPRPAGATAGLGLAGIAGQGNMLARVILGDRWALDLINKSTNR